MDENKRGRDAVGRGFGGDGVVRRGARRNRVAALCLLALAAAPAAAELPTLAAADGSAVAAGTGTATGALGAAGSRGPTVLGSARATELHDDTLWMADRVVVDKSDRQLHLISRGEVMRSYPISLGKNPLGHKAQEGDMRTPEGDYVLDWRNPTSDFFMSMHISYPNARDIQEANARGLSPGGLIMIHGLPNDAEATRTDYLYEDWTDGCIAVSNQAMIDIWLSVPDNTPITIVP